MDNLFLRYMFERHKRQEEQEKIEPGPVITLSREYGCYGSETARLLVDTINGMRTKQTERNEWIYVSHQVLQDASKKMGAKPHDIAHIFGAEEKTILGDLVSLFSKDKYYSNDHIKRTIARIVRSYSEQGHAVIVGRAGCVLARHIPRSIHVRIIAPFDWRAERIRIRFDISKQDAEKKLKLIDRRRETFMKFFRGNKPDSELFDLILNRSTLSLNEIVQQIIFFAQQRNLL